MIASASSLIDVAILQADFSGVRGRPRQRQLLHPELRAPFGAEMDRVETYIAKPALSFEIANGLHKFHAGAPAKFTSFKFAAIQALQVRWHREPFVPY